ncbi:MAG: hypothetical protein HY589_05165 [Candidatus Omnitrophica bacterium]|nr:hypothetical protein [Candidatus Omnitrophota bacterium]
MNKSNTPGFTPLHPKEPSIENEGGVMGFTLIELLIVGAVILALVSISSPLFQKSFADLQLRQTASNIARFAGLAQQRAIIDRRIYKLQFDFEERSYRLFFAGGEGQAVKFESPRDRFGRRFLIPEGLQMSGQTREALFYPDGKCDVIELGLKNKNGKFLVIATTGMLGDVVINEAK